MNSLAAPIVAFRDENATSRPSRRSAQPLSPWPSFFALVALYAVTSAAACLAASHLVWNATASMARGLYWMAPRAAVQPGDVVAFRIPASVRSLVHDRHYLPGGNLLMKPVVAVAGDPVCARGGLLFVGDAAFGSVLRVDSQGRSLPQYSGCGPIPSGQVFVASRHPQSFDSRSFGPVDVRALQGTVTPLWIH